MTALTASILDGVEEWRPVDGWEGHYEVSSRGQIRSLPRRIVQRNGHPITVRGKILKPIVTSADGRSKVTMNGGGRTERQLVHRMVLTAFAGPCPDGLEACHNNGNPTDNRLRNLRWDTHSGNMQDMVRHGRSRAAYTHCKHGHPFDDINTYLHPQGFRQCRTCDRTRPRRPRKRKANA